MERIFEWFGNGKKMIAGGILLLAGMVGQSFSEKTLAQIPFVLMASGVMCFVNVLFSKITAYNINILLYLLINIAVMETGLYLTSYHIPGSDTGMDSMTVVLIWILCILAAWILQTLLLRISGGMAKRMSLAFFETLLSAVAVLAAFIVPIILAVVI